MHAIRAMTINDYDSVVALMKQTPGVSFRDADSRESTSRYLQRNPGLGILKSHIDVLKTNELAPAYWESQGWKFRSDIYRYSWVRSGVENA